MLRNFNQEGRKFRRQHSIGPFIADFCCVQEKLVIELDGQVHFNPGAQDYDYNRQQYIEQEGYTVLRFENKRVFETPEAVLQAIRNHFEGNMARDQGLV